MNFRVNFFSILVTLKLFFYARERLLGREDVVKVAGITA